MKKALLFLALCAGPVAYAQQFGISAHGLMSFQLNRPVSVPYSDREMESGIAPAPGFRFEANYLLPGYGSFPIAAYSGLAITYLSPATDSVVYTARRTGGVFSGDLVDIAGTARISTLSISLRFGYEIPQDFNEFLMINYGGGMGWMRSTRRYILPEQSSTFNYTADDFEAEDFEAVRKSAFGLELFLGATYEFERFSLIGQYSVWLPMGDDGPEGNVFRLRHGFSAGIFYTLRDFR